MREAPPNWMSPVPATHQPPTPVYAPAPHDCICCRYCDCASTDFPSSAFSHTPVSPGGGFPSRVPLLLCAPALTYPSSPPNPGIVWSLVSCQVDVRRNGRGQDASNPWQLLALALTPPRMIGWQSCWLILLTARHIPAVISISHMIFSAIGYIICIYGLHRNKQNKINRLFIGNSWVNHFVDFTFVTQWFVWSFVICCQHFMTS